MLALFLLQGLLRGFVSLHWRVIVALLIAATPRYATREERLETSNVMS
jgi:hypothetical protein